MYVNVVQILQSKINLIGEIFWNDKVLCWDSRINLQSKWTLSIQSHWSSFTYKTIQIKHIKMKNIGVHSKRSMYKIKSPIVVHMPFTMTQLTHLERVALT